MNTHNKALGHSIYSNQIQGNKEFVEGLGTSGIVLILMLCALFILCCCTASRKNQGNIIEDVDLQNPGNNNPSI